MSKDFTSDHGSGFPFSSTSFSERATIDRLGSSDRSAVGINEPRIADGHLADTDAAVHAIIPLQPEAGGRLTLPRRAAHRFSPTHAAIRQPALRVFPLASFAWGSRGDAPRPRTNPDHALLWVTAGEMRVDFPRQRHVLPHDTVQFIPAGTAFAAFPGSDAKGVALLFAPALIRDTEPLFPGHPVAGTASNSSDNFINMINLLEKISSKEDVEVNTLHDILHTLARQLQSLEPVRRPECLTASTGDSRRPLAERFLAAASKHLRDGNTIAGIAADLGANTATLDRTCREAYGKRAIELTNELRIKQATELLRDNNLSLTRIARSLGYTSLGHFTRSFVAATGRSPEAYRNQSCG